MIGERDALLVKHRDNASLFIANLCLCVLPTLILRVSALLIFTSSGMVLIQSFRGRDYLLFFVWPLASRHSSHFPLSYAYQASAATDLDGDQ